LPLYLIAATVPVAVAVTLEDLRRRRPIAVGGERGLDRGRHRHGDHRRLARDQRTLEDLGFVDAMLIGAQALALVPGVSRSGATICCAWCWACAAPRRRASPSCSASRPSPRANCLQDEGRGRAARRRRGHPAGGRHRGRQVSPATLRSPGSLRFLGNNKLRGFAIYRVALGALLIALMVAGTLTFAGV
jgi:undecaprenyl-diphosphatase